MVGRLGGGLLTCVGRDLLGRSPVLRSASRAPNTRPITDSPSPRPGLANPRRDNQRRRRWDPRPSNWGPPARHKEPTRHSSAAPMRRNRSAFPFAQMARALGASRSSPHASPNCCRPLLAQRRALDPSSLALSSNPAKQRGPLPGHSIGPRGWSAPSALGRRWISS